MCLKSRAFCLSLVVLFFLCSATSWGLVCYEDAVAEELNSNLTMLGSIVTTQSTLLTQQEILIRQQAISIVQSAESIATSKQETLLQIVSSDAAKSLWQKEKNAMTIKIIASGGIGVLLGGFIYWLVEALGGGRA